MTKFHDSIMSFLLTVNAASVLIYFVKFITIYSISSPKHILFVLSSDTVVLGGTAQLGNFSREINEEDKAHILRETLLVEPTLNVRSISQYQCIFLL